MQRETRVAVKVWDAPVRIFHWAIVLLLGFQLVTGKVGGDLMEWHMWSGYSVLVLVVFRVFWGFAGGRHARFASFLTGPATAWHFARRLFSRAAVASAGHNPLGGWMVVALLASLALQAMSGLFANDGASAEGPLASRVSIEVSNLLTEFHRWNLDVLLVLSGVHLAAVLFHWIAKKENLTAAMFSGVKHLPGSEDAPGSFVAGWRAPALLALAAVLVWVAVAGLR